MCAPAAGLGLSGRRFCQGRRGLPVRRRARPVRAALKTRTESAHRIGRPLGRLCLTGQARSVEVMAVPAIGDAPDIARRLLADELPRRWGHVQAVAAKAEGLRVVLGDDADLLVTAAWLHDIGYPDPVKDSGFHPLDGAHYLQSLGADPRLCRLVANHSGAKYEAPLRGLSDELAEFPDEQSLARDGLWYCDMTTSPVGQPVTFDERLAEIRQRYGPDHTVPRGITAAAEEIRSAIAAVQAAAEPHGVVAVG